MYKIGELSKIVDIPIKTLRYYDEQEILHPAQIDKFTGYRYYNDENIIECELIKSLKAVNFTLQEIKEYINSPNKQLFINKQKEIIEEIKYLTNKYERLSTMINNPDEFIKVRTLKNKETKEEKIVRRKYERKNFRKYL